MKHMSYNRLMVLVAYLKVWFTSLFVKPKDADVFYIYKDNDKYVLYKDTEMYRSNVKHASNLRELIDEIWYYKTDHPYCFTLYQQNLRSLDIVSNDLSVLAFFSAKARIDNTDAQYMYNLPPLSLKTTDQLRFIYDRKLRLYERKQDDSSSSNSREDHHNPAT